MRQAVAGMTANRDEMSSSEYQHSSFTITSGNLEEVFFESKPSFLSHLSFSKTWRHSKPCCSGCDIPSLFSLTSCGSPASYRIYFGSCSSELRAKSQSYHHRTTESITH
ncbi:unnamed protein product [Fusarium venenatum]|uniref:Uncharacterized protein n=1 Tax=Fusarium venenatum TaxID=56646 RepID=A0A2L2T3X0_9HYPO|nr:uncharacterized protein FVRRES_01964 [Fusarium venenatum]CEI65452.1 unnamed protein product [Fusarium venenatum]